MNVKELQECQAEYDRSFWKHNHSDFEKMSRPYACAKKASRCMST